MATGQPFSQTDVVTLADEIIASKYTKPANPALQASDISGVSDPEATVVLKSVRDLTNVNALLGAQEMTFSETGLTVVFGDNGSGKSGYARIIKDVASARHHQPIHVNVFAATATSPQKADVTFLVDGDERTSTWPNAAEELKAISFYDEACGDVYLSADSEMTYRPSALVIIDDLIALCDAVRAEIENRIKQNNSTKGSLPVVVKETAAASILSKLRATTTKAELDAACELPDEWEERYSWLVKEEGRLRATNPIQERARLQGLAAKVDQISKHIAEVADALSDAKVESAKQARKSAVELRAAADIASSGSFDDEPLSGVGSLTWRSLWEAARRYSEQEAYSGQSFPVTSEGAHCVLCQQVLGAEASDRLGRFHSFLTDTTASSADNAERALRSIMQVITSLELTPATVLSSLVTLEGEQPELAEKVTQYTTGISKRKTDLLKHLEDGEALALDLLAASPQTELDVVAARFSDKAKETEVEGFNAMLDAVVAEKDDLQSRKELSDGRDALETEIERLGELHRLSEAKALTGTTHISRKASELTEQHVTTLVRDRFIRESDRLSLEHIELKRTGGSKGKLHHRPSLLGAKTVQPVDEVLSEGEQTALGLAGYFTEAHFDGSGSALVLDDPVTSLDHIRRAQVAESLVRFAADRQVIVFTHDLAFLRDLMTRADEAHIALAERTVQRLGSTPGQVSDGYPWKAKDVKRRFDELTVSLKKLKADRPNLRQDAYEEECAKWSGKLSEAWERVISLELIAPVVDPVTDFIRPQSFRVLAKITDNDNEEFQQSYSRCTTWLRRHDKSQTMNYVAPEPPALEAELTLVKSWHDRVRKYKNN
jgi:ABC-type Mn2+/Zn2+ transport system ATPase subunit